MPPTASETTALLPKPPSRSSSSSDASTVVSQPPQAPSIFPPIYRVFFGAFLISLAFSFTQTSIIYIFRIMTCDEYYKTHEWTGQGDRCSLPSLEAASAQSIAVMSMITTSSSIVNVFYTGFLIRRFGAKAAMFQQAFWLAGRNLTQIYAVTVGGATGMRILQAAQAINMVGSGGGYSLAANSFVAYLAGPAKRTAMFGVLSGIQMMGSSIGFTIGGFLFVRVNRLAPWQVAFCFFVISAIFGVFLLPYVSPHDSVDPKKKSQGFLAPLKMFWPRKHDDCSGRDFSLTLLGLGAFTSVLATGYTGVGLQLIGTNIFGWQPSESGLMMSLTLSIRAFFLTVVFPRVISTGRRLVSGSPPSEITKTGGSTPDPAEEPEIVSVPTIPPLKPTDVKHGSLFDLYFLRWSIFTDGLLASCVSFASEGWHLYAAAAILPFASGTGPACKGVVMEFVPQNERSDALSAIALVEMLAFVSTTGLFGYVFALLSEIGHPTKVFLVNGAVAMLAFIILCGVRMPRLGLSSAA